MSFFRIPMREALSTFKELRHEFLGCHLFDIMTAEVLQQLPRVSGAFQVFWDGVWWV